MHEKLHSSRKVRQFKSTLQWKTMEFIITCPARSLQYFPQHPSLTIPCLPSPSRGFVSAAGCAATLCLMTVPGNTGPQSSWRMEKGKLQKPDGMNERKLIPWFFLSLEVYCPYALLISLDSKHGMPWISETLSYKSKAQTSVQQNAVKEREIGSCFPTSGQIQIKSGPLKRQ